MDVQRTEVEVERHPAVEVKEPQVVVEEHHRGAVPSTSASRRTAVQDTISGGERSRSRKRNGDTPTASSSGGTVRSRLN
jgi:hypothetical protein